MFSYINVNFYMHALKSFLGNLYHIKNATYGKLSFKNLITIVKKK